MKGSKKPATAARLAAILADRSLQERLHLQQSAWYSWRPRPDRPEIFDQQSSFYHSRDLVSWCMGGNASGKTEAAAAKLAKYLLKDRPPPIRDTPLWVISNTYEQVCGVCWGQKWYGKQHIPACEVDWPRIRWLNRNMNWPLSVPLKPWPGRPDANWLLEFKSCEQGRRNMQAKAIGGFWFSEQFPWDIFQEVLRGCREYMYPGGQVAEFTPVEPDLCIELEKLIDDPPTGWGFYRLSTEANRPNLAAAWYESFVAAIPEEMRATRLSGALAIYEGTIFQTFSPILHVFDGPIHCPAGVEHFRGLDWGSSLEHPFACVWGYRDGMGDWTIYREYWNNRQDQTTADQIEAVKERSAAQRFAGTFADPSRPDQLNNWAASDVAVQPARNAVYEGIDCIRSLLKVNPATNRPRLRIHASCKHLVEELRKYRWLKSRRTGIIPQAAARPAPLKKDDDCADALRYAIYSVERGYGQAPASASYRHYEERESIRFQRHR